MPVMRRRPIARAAMVGGAAYVGTKAATSKAQAQAQAQAQDTQQAQQNAEQEARLAALEQQASQQATAPAQAPAPAAGGELVTQLTQLKSLLDAGALTQAEFDDAKQQLLSA